MMRNDGKNVENFSLYKRAKSFRHALRGIALFLKNTHNAWVQLVIFAGVIFLGVYFCVTRTEWLALIIVSGLVFIAEAFNTAIEIHIDLTSPEYHPFAQNTKDVAAGAVLIAAITAITVGLIIFLPYILR